MIKIVTGKIHSYKTTRLIQHYLLTRTGDGFVSIKFMKESVVSHYDLQRLSTGETFPFVIRENEILPVHNVRCQIGPYCFLESGFQIVEASILEMIDKGVSPIYLDEIGLLEREEKGFSKLFQTLIDRGTDLCVVIRKDILPEILKRYHIKDYEIIGDSMYDIAIINGNVWMNHGYARTNIYVQNDRIVNISNEVFEASEVIDVKGDLVMPGLIDPHVHFKLNLGPIQSRDDFFHGSKQAALGGVSIYIDFLDPVDNPEDLEKAYYQRKSEVEQSYVDYFFHATLKQPKCDLEEFVKKMLSLKIYSLKVFTTYSDSGRRTDDKAIIELLKLSEMYHFLLLVHAENDYLIDLNTIYTYLDLPNSRPSEAEVIEALKLASYVRQYGGFLYMVHVSSGQTIQALMSEYSDIINTKFFIESCPQYFYFTRDDLLTEKGYLYTFAPPVRTKEEQQLLKRHIDSIYGIGTDHCAFHQEDKMNLPLYKMPLGIGGIEFSFDMMYAMFGDKVINKMSENIAKLYPNCQFTGSMNVGNFANIFVYHLEENTISLSHGSANYSLYKDKARKGYVRHHMVRGKWVLKNNNLCKPIGEEI